jgi:hypothetical protein
MEKMESEKIGTEQEPINENTKNLVVRSDVNTEQSNQFGGNGDGQAAEEQEETMEDILNEASDMTIEELAELDKIAKDEVEKSKYVLFDYGAVIVSADTKKIKRNVDVAMRDDEIITRDEWSVIQRHPLLGDIQKIMPLSKPNSMRWQKLIKNTGKRWWKVSKKGTGFNRHYEFKPYEAE